MLFHVIGLSTRNGYTMLYPIAHSGVLIIRAFRGGKGTILDPLA